MTNIIAGITKDLKAVPKKLKEKAKSADVKKLILLNLPYVLAGYFCNKAAFLWRVAEGSNASDKMMVVMSQMDRMFSNPFPSFFLSDLLIGIAGGVALKFIVYYKAKNIIFKYRIHIWLYIFGIPPPCRTVFHTLPEFLGILRLIINNEF